MNTETEIKKSGKLSDVTMFCSNHSNKIEMIELPDNSGKFYIEHECPKCYNLVLEKKPDKNPLYQVKCNCQSLREHFRDVVEDVIAMSQNGEHSKTIVEMSKEISDLNNGRWED